MRKNSQGLLTFIKSCYKDEYFLFRSSLAWHLTIGGKPISMNALKLFSFLAISTVAFSACKKDDEKSTADKMQGRWTYEMTTSETTVGSLTILDTTFAAPNDYYDFRGDNNLYSRVNGVEDTTVYSLLPSSEVVLYDFSMSGNDTFNINTLNNNQFILSRSYQFGGDQSETKTYLRK